VVFKADISVALDRLIASYELDRFYNARDTLQDLINQKKRLNDRRALIIFNDSMYFRHPEKKEAIRFALQNYAQIITLITQNG
jgi:hypothetical protein